jgi:Flp pilus assembly secretin CpaC
MKHRVSIGIFAAASLFGGAVAMAQDPKEAKPSVAQAAGPRLRVRFQESHQREGKTTTAQPCILVLHTGEKATEVFVGAQVALRTSDKGTPTVIFKNAGIDVQVSAQALPDGRYRLEATFEESSPRNGGSAGAGPSGGENPILQALKGEAAVVLRAGETVPFASAADPVTGEIVRVDVSVDVLPESKAVFGTGAKDGRLRARVVLSRRQGERRIASRPYAVVVQAEAEKAAHVFSGSMLPVEVSYQGQPTVMLKDIGAGLRLDAHRTPDGRYRLDLSISDGTLAAALGSPRVQAFRVESRLYLRVGETVVVASAADPQTGEVVEAELTLEEAGGGS